MDNLMDNIILKTDSYKQSHHAMYPDDLEFVHSYLEPRIGGEYNHVLFFGLQGLLKSHFVGQVVTQEKIDEARDVCYDHFGSADVFNEEGWNHILDAYEGRLPVSIYALEEGTFLEESNALLTIVNTDPKCEWLVNHLETLLVQLWYPITVATAGYHLHQMIKRSLEESGTPEDSVFKLHDFGYRGSTSHESAAIGGAAHLVNFRGTDTLVAYQYLRRYYEAKVPGVSVPAAEHSVICSWGKENEALAFNHILKKYPTGLVSVVSDTWDIFGACRDLWGRQLKSDVEKRQGVLVVRPDSGDPATTVIKCLDILGEAYGYTVNSKGYKVLPDSIRLIQGDGISRRSLQGIIAAILEAGWSGDNITFGSGGGLLQDYNRDTQRFAMKASWVQRAGLGMNVYKRPTTDTTKQSKLGILGVNMIGNAYRTTNVSDLWTDKGELKLVFANGELVNPTNLDRVRSRVELT